MEKIQFLIFGKKKHLKCNLKIESITIEEFIMWKFFFQKLTKNWSYHGTMILQNHIENLCRMTSTRGFMHSGKLENIVIIEYAEVTPLPKICQNTGFLRLVFSHVPSHIPSSYWKIWVRKNSCPGIFWTFGTNFKPMGNW